MQDEVTMSCEQLNKLNSLLEKISEYHAAAIHVTNIIFRMMPPYKKAEHANICKVTDNLTKIKDTISEISDLTKNVKDNYIKEISETTKEGEEVNG